MPLPLDVRFIQPYLNEIRTLCTQLTFVCVMGNKPLNCLFCPSARSQYAVADVETIIQLTLNVSGFDNCLLNNPEYSCPFVTGEATSVTLKDLQKRLWEICIL